MIKKINVSIFITLNILFFSSCIGNTPSSSLLKRAEMLMEQSPDSSLILLQEIEQPQKLPEKQYALWCLLYTQAQDRNYISHTSDSLINRAASYFEQKNEEAYLMKSLYYKAAVYHDLKDYPRAQEFYLKALVLAKGSGDYALLARICSNLGTIYINIDLFTEALKFENEALNLFSLLNDSTNTGIVLRNIGWIYAETGQPDNGIIYYRRAIPLLDLNNHFYLYNEIGSLYKQVGDYEKAFHFARLARDTSSPDDDLIPVYHNLGALYQLTNQRDSAIFYLTQCTLSANPHAKMGAYLHLADLEEKRQNWQACTVYLQRHIQIKDSLTRLDQAFKLQRVQSFFNYQQVEKERFFHKQDADKKRLYTLSTFIIIR